MIPPQRSITNREFTSNELFVRACKLAGIEPTKRQASKWRNARGRAYVKRHEAAKESTND